MLPRSHNMLKFLYHNAAKTSHNTLGSVQLYIVHTGYVKEPLKYGIRNECHTVSGCRVITNSSWAIFSRCLSNQVQESAPSTRSSDPTKVRPTVQSDTYQSVGEDKSVSTETKASVASVLEKGASGVKLSVSVTSTALDQEHVHFKPFGVKPVVGAELEEEEEEEDAPPTIAQIIETYYDTDVPREKIYVKLANDGSSTLERNFITPVRAMSDFLLKPTDLEGLRKTKRRSPYENEPPITVYWRKDVEAKAIDVWGSREKLVKELVYRDAERKRQSQDNIFSVKRQLRAYNKKQQQQNKRPNRNYTTQESGLFGTSGRVVMTAVVINMSNFAFKLFAWLYTGSHSMFSECVHSLADTINQLILVYGIHKSIQPSDTEHPYGYSNMKYVASLISGVGIFCVGTGLSIYHGVDGLLHPVPLQSFYWAYFILGGSLVSEGATLLVAYNSIRRGAKNMNMTFSEYVLRGQDPSVNVVLMEDFAAVIGVLVAGSCMGLTSYYGSPIPDAVGSLLVGGILGSVASFIIYTNVAALVGRSIQQDRLDRINEELESDIMIRAIHDVKGIDMGNSLVRYKAEVDFDGRELTRSYLAKQDLAALLKELRAMERPEQLEIFILQHGENIVDMMGGEIDRIEMKLRMNHPEIRHCDLEIL